MIVGMVLIAFNFRTPITSLSPILETIQQDLQISYTVISLLTMIPTACFGLFAFAATPVSRRLGREQGIFWAVVLIGVGIVLRLWGTNIVVLYATTFLVGIGIAVSQTLLPSIISEYFASRTALVTGLYTASLTLGSGVAAGATPFLVGELGTWTAALGAWGVPALLAAGLWAPLAFRYSSETGADAVRTRLPWRNHWAWVLTIFYGAQSLLFYTTLTWLAPHYVSLGWTPEESSFLLSLFFVGQLGGTLGIAPVSDRWSDRRPWLGLVLAMTGVGFTGVVFVPLSFPFVWAVLLGMGLGGIFALNMALPVDFTPDPDATDRLTSMMIGIGYLIAALGPFVAGVIRDATGGYRPSFVALLLITVALLVPTMLFDPDRTIV